MADDSTITGGDIQAAEQAVSGSSPEPISSPESTPAVSASADATVPPAADAPVEASPSTQTGEPPKERWNDILANARQKAAEEAVAPLAWAKQVNQQEFQSVVDLARRASADPINYLQDFIKELQTHPTYGAQLKSLAARALAQRNPPAVEDQEPQPDLPIQLEDGRVVHLYSAGQQAKREAFLQQQWLAQVEQKFQPVTQTIETLRAREAEAVRQNEIHTFVTSTHQDVATWPGMQDAAMQAAVAQELATMRLQSDDPREISLALNAAYRKVVLPTLQRTATRSVLTNIRQQADASTVNPAQTSTRAPKSMQDMSIAEALQHVAAQSA